MTVDVEGDTRYDGNVLSKPLYNFLNYAKIKTNKHIIPLFSQPKLEVRSVSYEVVFFVPS